MSKPFIDFDCIFTAKGPRYSLCCAELPVGFYCRIYPAEDGHGWVRKTKANGNGSIRYEWNKTEDDAFEAARKWAYRKVAEARRSKIEE